MNVFQRLKDTFYRGSNQNWWVEITTAEPRCLYYFGPFQTCQEAEEASPGYVEDLEAEQAKEIQTVVKCCQPSHLTLCDESNP
jgi:hypothetical protein